MKAYGSYLFKDKDPVIDEMRTLIEDTLGEKVSKKNLKAVSEAGGPSASCMGSWFFGKTVRPSSTTIEAAGRALGYHRTWVKMTKAEREKVEAAVARHNRRVTK